MKIKITKRPLMRSYSVSVNGKTKINPNTKKPARFTTKEAAEAYAKYLKNKKKRTGVY